MEGRDEVIKINSTNENNATCGSLRVYEQHVEELAKMVRTDKVWSIEAGSVIDWPKTNNWRNRKEKWKEKI